MTPAESATESARELIGVLRVYVSAAESVSKASAKRFALPAGSSRARITTANARHAIACEHRDHIEAHLRDEYGVDLHRRVRP